MYVTKDINLRKHTKADLGLTIKLELNSSYFREYYYGDKPCEGFTSLPRSNDLLQKWRTERTPDLEGK